MKKNVVFTLLFMGCLSMQCKKGEILTGNQYPFKGYVHYDCSCYGHIHVLEGQNEIAKMLNVSVREDHTMAILSCFGDSLCTKDSSESVSFGDTIYFNCKAPSPNEIKGCGIDPRDVIITSQAFIVRAKIAK